MTTGSGVLTTPLLLAHVNALQPNYLTRSTVLSRATEASLTTDPHYTISSHISKELYQHKYQNSMRGPDSENSRLDAVNQ